MLKRKKMKRHTKMTKKIIKMRMMTGTKKNQYLRYRKESLGLGKWVSGMAQNWDSGLIPLKKYLPVSF